jgi:hypothetical protein
MSLLSETPITFVPTNSGDLETQYSRCKAGLGNLHSAIIGLSRSADILKLFTEGRHFIEPIFYSGSSAFWIDYLEIAPQLYELDNEFLERHGYPIARYAELLRHMHDVFRLRFRDFVRAQKRKIKKGSFIESPLPCFVFSAEDLDKSHAEIFSQLVERFSIKPGDGPTVESPIGFHPAKSNPALRIDEKNIFVPLIPMLCEQLFENPYYIIVKDSNYFKANANNRGTAAENIIARILTNVDGLKIFSDVKLYRGKDEVDQIDALAIFGTTAIVFETKTKRLTEISKLGNTEKLIQDVREGLLGAQQQLQNTRRLLLDKNYHTARVGTEKLDLSEVTQAICISVMVHEIPSYPLLIRTIFEKENIAGIIPLTIFDLKIIAHYLNNAFDFLYYFAVRSVLDQSLSYGTEQALLGYHLKVRLNVPENVDLMYVDDDFGQRIDADYPSSLSNGGAKKLNLSFGIEIVDDLIDQIIKRAGARFFRLFSVFRGMSGAAAKELKGLLRQMERMLLQDGNTHDATMIFEKIALTFILGKSLHSIERHAQLIMAKRDAEKKFEQEYLVFLLPEASGTGKSMVIKKLSSRLILAGAAMKERRDALGVTAFSPRIPKDTWDIQSDK